MKEYPSMKQQFIFLLVCIFVLSGCSFPEKTNTDPFSGRDVVTMMTKNEPQVYRGYIEEIPLTLQKYATHQLKEETGQVILAKSSVISLNTFLEQEAFFTGTLEKIYDDFVLTITEVEKIIPPEVLPKYELFEGDGYTLTYPQEWKKRSNRVLTQFIPGTGSTITVRLLFGESIENVGTPITVGHFSGERILQSEKIIVLLELQPKKRIRFEFTNPGDESMKDTFYTFVESIQLGREMTKISVEDFTVCGGIRDPSCPEGFRCELPPSSGKGRCIPLDFSGKNIFDDEMKKMSKNKEVAPEKETASFSKTTESSFEELSPSFEGIPYKNMYKHFSLLSPKQWYFKSFGPTDTTEWRIEFGPEEIKKIGDGKIVLEIVPRDEETVKIEENDMLRIFISRDDVSHFEIYGKKEYDTFVRGIASSIKNE